MPSQGTILIAIYLCTLLPASSTTGGNYEVGLGSPCSCNIRGRVYNLAPLASSDGFPRFETDVKRSNFAYNPCIPFTVKVPDCQDVAICRWNNKETTYTALGLQQDVQCQLEEGVEELVFQVPNTSSEKTRIRLKCNPKLRSLHDARFQVIDENPYNTVLEVEHYCCCPDACPLGKPLPTKKAPVDIGKWAAVTISGIFGLVCIIGGIYFVYRCCCRQRRDGDQEGQNILDDRRNRPGEN